MASKFQIWVDDSHLNKVQTYSEFLEDSERTSGFTGGTPAKATKVNTVLRQANLVACALMNIVDNNGTTDFRSPVTSIQSLISNYLSNLTVKSATSATSATTASKLSTNAGSTSQPVYFANGVPVGITGSIGNSTTGNAASATKLQTARTIGGVSFDGTANINLPGVNTSGNQNTTGNAATATKLQTARNIGGVSFNGTANINLPGVNTKGNQDTSGTAENANKIQNVDLSSNNSATFGDYVIEKKKLLWSGTQTVTDTFVNLYFTNNQSLEIGDTVEIVWGIEGGLNPIKVDRFRVEAYSDSVYPFNTQFILFSSLSQIYICGIEAQLYYDIDDPSGSGKRIRFNTGNMTGIKGINTKDGNLTCAIRSTTAGYSIYKIFKIIG